jgi:hypothetical protein
MQHIFSREPDPLDGMLRPPSLPDNEALRQAVYARTRRLLHRRRRLRQFAYAAALLLSFAAGLLAMRLATPQPPPLADAPERLASKDEPQLPNNPPPSSDESALAREWIAFDSEDDRGERFRQAGDRYMTEENDPQSALRCYGNALDHASEQDLAISTNDNWLLMAIKDARQKEKDHAKQGG